MDHKFKTTFVLPGAAYIAIAIEALSQIQSLHKRLARGDEIGFECRNVNMIALLPLREDDDNTQTEDTELHTALVRGLFAILASNPPRHQ